MNFSIPYKIAQLKLKENELLQKFLKFTRLLNENLFITRTNQNAKFFLINFSFLILLQAVQSWKIACKLASSRSEALNVVIQFLQYLHASKIRQYEGSLESLQEFSSVPNRILMGVVIYLTVKNKDGSLQIE